MPKKVPNPVDKPVERRFTTRGGGKAVRAAGGFVVDVPQKLGSLKGKLAVDAEWQPGSETKTGRY